MIAAKTRLKKMPKTCEQCDYRELYRGFGEDFCRIAGAFCPWEKKQNGMFGLGKPDWCPLMDADEMFANAPTVDAVEVCRCLECKHHEDEEIGMVYCPNMLGGWVEENWFCADGERKDGDCDG